MIEHVLVGEVVAGYPPSHEKNRSGLRWEYAVKCNTSGNVSQTFPHCIAVEPFSGLLNYVQQVAPCTANASTAAYAAIDSPGARQGTVGARCVLAFPAGDTRSPIIIGWLPHESSPVVVDQPQQIIGTETQLESEKVYPALKAAFNGMQFHVTEIGEFYVTHFGHTEISSKPYDSVDIKGPPPEYTTRMSWLEKGEWIVEDSQGQCLSIDPELQLMYLGNGENTIYLDKKNKLISLVTSGKYEEVSGTDRYRFVGGIETVEIKKDQSILIEANAKREIKGKIEEKITGEAKYTFENKYAFESKDATLKYAKLNMESKDTEFKNSKFTLTSSGDIALAASGGAKLKLSGGKVALGTSSAELVDSLIKILDQFINNAATIVATSVGPGQLNPTVVSQLGTLKTALAGIKGSL